MEEWDGSFDPLDPWAVEDHPPVSRETLPEDDIDLERELQDETSKE